MPVLKIFVHSVLLLFLVGCATRLESTREYMAEGDKESASENLLEHAKESSIEQLSSTEYKTGIDFLSLLEDMNSTELLTQVYNLKYSSLSLEKNYFIFSGRFSSSILSMAMHWKMTELQDRIADKVEQEIPRAQHGKYDKGLQFFARFAALHLSKNQIPHPNLSEYWGTMPYEKYLDEYKAFWDQAKSENALSVVRVIERNFLKRLNENRDQIIKIADKKELSFIFASEAEYTDKSEFTALRNAMKVSIEEGRKVEKAANSEIELLKPRVLKASDRLQTLENERRDLQLRNLYTYEESVQCQVCTGRGEVRCSPCRGLGVCRHCDRGHVDCRRCFRRGFYDCDPCNGRGWYRECQRVWDPCKKCYVERYVRVRCLSCFGSGTITCGCSHGRVVCRRCDGHFECRTCRGSRLVTCTSCTNGTIIKIRKTVAGKDIDNRIAAAETQQSALLNRLNKLEWLVRREKERRKIFNEFL